MSTIKNRQEATAWQRKYDVGAPRIGDLASDFASATLIVCQNSLCFFEPKSKNQADHQKPDHEGQR